VPAAGTSFERVWQVPDAQVASGRIPGYVAAVRVGGQVAVRAGGRMATEPDSAPMGQDTLFRIASVTKPIGGALTLSLVQDGGQRSGSSTGRPRSRMRLIRAHAVGVAPGRVLHVERPRTAQQHHPGNRVSPISRSLTSGP
jgi:hypothetical protein